MSTILQKAGLDPVAAAGYGTAIKILNTVMTVVAIVLVERKGRVFLLKLGTGGIIVSLVLLALLFYRFESQRVDVRAQVAAMVSTSTMLNNAPIKAANGKVSKPTISPTCNTTITAPSPRLRRGNGNSPSHRLINSNTPSGSQSIR